MKAHTGEFAEVAPRALLDNLVFRRNLIDWATAEGQDWQVHKDRRDHVWAMCHRDPAFFADVFVWSYDPRVATTSSPFILYDFQREALAQMVDALGREDFLIEKSRDMGASWLCSVLFLWAWIFSPTKLSFLLVSRKEELVDKRGDMKSLMARLDFVLERLPKWLTPRYTRTHMSLLNNDSGSAINGESTTGDVARGDRRTAILLDEFAAVDSDYAVLRATRDATNCRLFNSTPRGASGAFWDMRCKDTLLKFRFHWSMHPDKARGLYVDDTGKQRSPWYDAEVARAVHPMEVAQELDIDYNASDAQFFDDATIDAASTFCRDPSWSADPVWDPDTGAIDAFVGNPKGAYRSWVPFDLVNKPPQSGKYALGIDVSQGTGATPSVISVGDLMTGERIAEFVSSSTKPDQLAALAVGLARLYNDAYIVWEINGPGNVFTDQIVEMGYRNVYRRNRVKRNDRSFNSGNNSLGWHTSKESKMRLLGLYRRALSEKRLKVYSKASLDECRSYVFVVGGDVSHNRLRGTALDLSAARENHGDRVIADALLALATLEHAQGETQRKASPLAPPVGSLAWRRRELALSSAKETWW